MRSHVMLAVALAVAVAACDAGAATGRPSPSVSVAPSTGIATAVPPTASAAPAITLSPTAVATATTEDGSGAPPADPDPASFLQVCAPFPGTSDAAPIRCGQAVKAALAAAAVAGAAPPARVDVRFDCAPSATCGAPDPDRTFVTVLASGTAILVELHRDGEGELTAVKVGPGTVPTAPAFAPPAAGLADVPDPPASIASRPPFPLCGEEPVDPDGTHDVAARRCFLAGVLAGSPVEFAEQGTATEGGAYAVLYRFAGSGGVEETVADAGAWTRTITGIAPVGGDEVFALDGLATVPEPVP